jgi:endonuclease YncB( thermonuclease family)
MRTVLALLVAGFAFTCTKPAAADVAGRASVIDGDTIEIHGERVRLFHIPAGRPGGFW